MSFSSRQGQYLGAMGIQRWELRDAAEDATKVDSTVPPPSPAERMSTVNEQIRPAPVMVESAAHPVTVPVDDLASLDWDALQQRVVNCQHCTELATTRTQTVFGVGNRRADWMLIGEAPGAEEDRQGEPFVGPAGQLLNAMLAALGLSRQQVYIANVLKCRPPNNRDPHVDEAAACLPWLYRQIALVQPKIILLVGRIAAQQVLGSDANVGKLRGQVHQYQDNIPMVVTYHPAYLLRKPSEKRKSWQDLCLARTQLEAQ